jgi:hypothetical protein
MKIGIITFHRALNYGALLQVFALQSSLDKMGYDTKIIDYRSPFIESHYKKNSFTKIFNLRNLYYIIFKNNFFINNRLYFEEFSKKYLKLTMFPYFNFDSLLNLNDEFDAFITGSDQVWNYKTAGFDKIYFLNFVSDNLKKFSYAASFGTDKIPRTLKFEYKSLLNSFNKISVREKEGSIIIKDLLGKSVPVVLDPTMLISKEEWIKYSTPINFSKGYVLLYLMFETKSIFKFARDLANKKGLNVIYINNRLFNKTGIYNLRNVTPSQWIYLFYNASYIVTNSFHGACFSINFNKNFFVELLPPPSTVNSRIINLLESFNIYNRIISSTSFKLEDVDFKSINEILIDKRKSSFSFIKSIERVF